MHNMLYRSIFLLEKIIQISPLNTNCEIKKLPESEMCLIKLMLSSLNTYLQNFLSIIMIAFPPLPIILCYFNILI
jgi:hypothetical protein